MSFYEFLPLAVIEITWLPMVFKETFPDIFSTYAFPPNFSWYPYSYQLGLYHCFGKMCGTGDL